MSYDYRLREGLQMGRKGMGITEGMRYETDE